MTPSNPAHTLDEDLRKIVEARHHDPFSVLGRHEEGDRAVVRAFLPLCTRVTIAEGELPMERIAGTDLFEWHGRAGTVPQRYRFIWCDTGRRVHISHDPYSFPPQLEDYDLHLFGEGKHWHAYRLLGAHSVVVEKVGGVLFSVWAPNAERVSVVGDFNRWDGRIHPMRVRGGSGVWELFIPDIQPGVPYKFEIRNRNSGEILLKSDPYGRAFEQRPKTASLVIEPSVYEWQDEEWLQARAQADWLHAPMSIYEVHLGSWQRGVEGEFLSYRELGKRLVDYVLEMGYTHIELLPISEHPYDPSWGYQTTGYYAPTSRFGEPDDFRWLVDHCHRNGIGVFLDWVPAHFPKDAHGLARFDGEPLYEHADPRRGEHLDWSTLIFNYARHEVKNFLLSNALYWIEEFHLDGLRVDAVASMLYLDYSRDEWIPNQFGGRENLEVIDFLRELNVLVHGEQPGALVMAEESTAWPQVTRPIYLGGLGFSLKWNMGWMNDTLVYFGHDPIYRHYHQGELTFSMIYAFTENFLLPFSHDEVVHGKGSMLTKMPGDDWQKFANLRLLYTYMFTHPGKKLLFMGIEFAQRREWDATGVIDWELLGAPAHAGVRSLVKDLNRMHRTHPALHRFDFDDRGFQWIDCNDSQNSVLVFRRKSESQELIMALNFTPVTRTDYRIGVPFAGDYDEIFNSDSEYYGGSNVGNGPGRLAAEQQEWMNLPYSLVITLPPLAGVILIPADQAAPEAEPQGESKDPSAPRS
jgi:1,4-alpha-glucan branching enzyme